LPGVNVDKVGFERVLDDKTAGNGNSARRAWSAACRCFETIDIVIERHVRRGEDALGCAQSLLRDGCTLNFASIGTGCSQVNPISSGADQHAAWLS
jgi:hypothetical protein